MNAIRTRRILWMIACLELLAGAAALSAAILIGVQLPAERSAEDPTQTGGPSVGEAGVNIGLVDFESLFARRFQRPLFDPPPPAPAPAPEVRAVPAPQVRLLATMIERGGNRAMFTDLQGSILFKGVGDTLSDGTTTATIVEISDSTVVLEHGGQRSKLTLESR